MTPYLYPDHDNIELFVREKGDLVMVSDLGETLRYLDGAGMDVYANPSLLYSVRRLASGYGVLLDSGVLVKGGAPETAGTLFFDVLSATKSVAAMIYGNRSFEPASFNEEVAEFLQTNQMAVERNVPITGRSGTPYVIPFQVRAGSVPVLLKTVSPRTRGRVRDNVNETHRMWSDIEDATWGKSQRVSLLNDDSLPFKSSGVAILERVSTVCRWTEPRSLRAALAA